MNTTHQINCLLIEDDNDDIEIFKMVLKMLTYSVNCVAFTSCWSSFEHTNFYEFKPDFIFLNFRLNQLNGKQCLSNIKCIKNWEKIPVIILSEVISDKEIEKLKKLDAYAFIRKPNSIIDYKNILDDFFITNYISK